MYFFSVSSLLFLFFFFNDTATTEIYTLSLHDALPIFTYILFVSMFLALGVAALAGDGLLDRKSTRLNSSHLGISYAVFCLKKKNDDPGTHIVFVRKTQMHFRRNITNHRGPVPADHRSSYRRRYVILAVRDVVFFFNDTATTEIYTLSLHDALPISNDMVVDKAGRAYVGNFGFDLVGGEDRKSTRLNSSHLGISYAVFCLKQKKKTLDSLIPGWDNSVTITLTPADIPI